MLENIQSGLDTISLLGSHITSNDNFIFISSNGYNIYNGMIMVFLKNILNYDNKLSLQFHSEIHTPEVLNSNFGVKTAATNNILAVSAISYNAYDGIIYIYELYKNKWIYRDKIYLQSYNKINGFGANIQLNNDELFISTFYNKVHCYKYNLNNKRFNIKNTLNIFNNNNINLDIKMIYDNINNLIISNLTNTLTIINMETLSYNYFTELTQYNCFYGSELFIYKSKLFVSCSLYYPFYNIPEGVINQIYIYDIIYKINNLVNIVLNQIITDSNNDPYFGSQLNVNDKYLIVSGRNYIYNYDYNNFNPIFKEKFIIPYSLVNYDYKVLLIDNYFIVGNYGFNELQGAIFIGNIIDQEVPLNINTISNIELNNMVNKIFLIVFLIFIGGLITIIITLFCYFFVSLFSPKIDEKKKKKEEEEYSPYKVYSYIGYVETDDIPVQVPYPMNYNTQYYNNSSYNPQYYYYRQYYNPYNYRYQFEKYKNENIYLNEKNVSNEKVVSYKGYTYDSIQEKYKEKIKPILDEIKKTN